MQGKRLRTKHLEVRILASPLFHPRVGFVVPRYNHSAVDRNRLKRQLREIIRKSVLATLPAVDVVIKARPNAYTAEFSTLAAEVAQTIRAADELVP
jgi:ribonuclease P protein component